MIDWTGQQLGSYRLLRRLGSGGFASVYLGQHSRISTQYAALKVLHLSDVDSGKFQQEAVTMASLVHPTIIRLFDFDIANGVPFLVMEYAHGGSLRTRHPQGSQLPLATVVQYVSVLASAIQYAHDKNVIHRDLKPENILLGSQGELRLSDFGLAVLSQTGRTTNNAGYGTGGTAWYMAPEQAKGKPEKASDQYALAIMAYEWLGGIPPFWEGNAINIQYQHTYEPIPPLREKRTDLLHSVEQVILQALAKAPGNRFPSVAVFAQVLEQTARPSSHANPVLARQEELPTPVAQSETLSTKQQHANQITQSQAEMLSLPESKQTPTVQPQRESSANSKDPSIARKHSESPPVPSTRSYLPPSTEAVPLASLNPQTLAPDTIYTKGEPEKRRMSRRTVITTGLALAGVVAVGGVLVENAFQHQSSSSPIGTLLYTYRGHSKWVQAVAWSPDGKLIASGGDDSTVQVWDATTGGNVYIYRGHSVNVELGLQAVAWSPDGKLIASGGGGTVQVWDATTGAHVYTYSGYGSSVQAVAWSPDGKRIASARFDNTVQVWDATTGGHVYTYRGHSKWVQAVAWSPDGKRIASGSGDGTVQVWDATTGAHVYTYHDNTGPVRAVAWSPDGKHIVSGSGDGLSFDGTVQVWDATTGGHVYTYRDNSGYVYAVAWSPDGKRIASASASPDKTVQMWDATTGAHVYTYRGHSNTVFAVAWSPDGKRIASGGGDGMVQVWSAVL